jgi:hypothetical protein
MLYRVLTCANIWNADAYRPFMTRIAHRNVMHILDTPMGGRLYREMQSSPTLESLGSTGNRMPKSHRAFDVDDLNIYTLQDIGQLKIEWTDIIEDHLRIELAGSADDDASSGDEEHECRQRAFTNRRQSRQYLQNDTLYLYWFDTEHFSWLSA